MKRLAFKFFVLLLSLTMIMSLFSACNGKDESKNSSDKSTGSQSSSQTSTTDESTAPIEFTMAYADNPTFPFNPDWLTVKEMEEFTNSKIKFEVTPYPDYNEKMTLVLNSGTAPDVISYIAASGPPFSTFGLNGALVPVNKYNNLLTNFNAQVNKYNLGDEIKKCYLTDGNLYYIPSIYSSPFYDSGPLIRTDLLEKYGLKTPTTYDEFYNVLKTFKQNDPSSLPLTTLVEARVLFRFTMPSFGVSLGKNSSSGSYVLSYDYDKKEYFAGAISDEYKEYLKYFARLYSEGLLDPELTNPNDKWASKLATGKSMATFAYYDQIGGVISNSSVPGMEIDMIPPLKGPAGAYTQPKDVTGVGFAFPATTTKRPDFEKLVQTIDKIFYSPEMAKLQGQGVEGITFDMVDGKVKYKDEFVNSPDGLYKTLQIKFGIGVDEFQSVWDVPTEMLKYDEKYAEINNVVAEMKGVPTIPPIPKFTADQEEEVALLKAPLADMFEVWTDAFISGKKDIGKDWNAYVAEAKSKDIDKLLKLYNDALK